MSTWLPSSCRPTTSGRPNSTAGSASSTRTGWRKSCPGGLRAGDQTHRRRGQERPVPRRLGQLGRCRVIGEGRPMLCRDSSTRSRSRARRAGLIAVGLAGCRLWGRDGAGHLDRAGRPTRPAWHHPPQRRRPLWRRTLPRAPCKGGTFLPRRSPASSSSPWVATVGAESSAPGRSLRVRRWCRTGTKDASSESRRGGT